MALSWRYARVAAIPTAAPTIAVAIQAWAVAGALIPSAGLTQDDAIQVATDLAVLRHTATCGTMAHYALFDSGGHLLKDFWAGADASVEIPQGGTVLPIVGDEPIRSAISGGNGELGDDWGAKIALAIDRTLQQLGAASRAGSVPEGFGSMGIPVMAPAIVAIIVGGAAVSIIATAAAWRYLDPALRSRIAAIRSAADAYQTRIATWRATGTLPPPSPIETANATAVRTAASEGSGNGWIWTGATVGGIVIGGLALSAIQSAIRG